MGTTVTQRIARWLLALCGWRAEILWPPVPHAIIVVYPHTSNWDFVWGMLARFATGLRVSWVGKDSLFRPPFGWILRRLGGIPVDRSRHSGLVEKLAGEFRSRDELWLAIAPEGTRSYADRLRSGFWHLAVAARVPVGLAYIDYARREVGLSRYVEMSGDADRDLALLREAYAGKRGRHPENAGEIRFGGDESR